MADYTTTATTRADVLTEIAADDTAGIARVGSMISAASALVDSYTLRPAGYFGPAGASATARRYRGNNSNFLQIGRHIRGTVTIQNVETALFYEHESNGWIYSIDNAAVAGSLADYPGTVRPAIMFARGALYVVSARWGFVAVPPDIDFAVRLIVQHLWDRGKGVIGQITPSGFVIERDIPPTARLILDNWKRREFEVT